MSLHFHLDTLELRTVDVFRFARDGGDLWQTVLVELEEDGLVGRGEAAPKAYYGESLAETVRVLRAWLIRRESVLDKKPRELLKTFNGAPSARAALDLALHDMAARRQGVRVDEYLGQEYGLEGGPLPQTSFTVGLDRLERMVEKVQEAAAYPILKVKLGTDHDLEIVAALREVTRAELRVDANTAWTVAETRAKGQRLHELGVTLLEQPLPREDIAGYRQLRGSLPLPVYADESCKDLSELRRLAGVVDGVNIKLSKCGGLAEACRMIAAARQSGMGIMVGCFIESSLAITGAACLARYVDHLDIDGAALLANDPFVGVKIPAGRVEVPRGVGIPVVRRGEKE